MFVATAREALWFLPFVTPIALYVAWTDMSAMKIPNKAVLALLAVFAVVGLIALPLEAYAWRWLHVVVVLAFGFVIATAGLVGAGDAKFGAAMAPFIAYGDLRSFFVIFCVTLLAAFLLHRGLRAIPTVRSLTPHWVSWSSKKFPMGLALGTSLVAHLALVAFGGP